MGRRRDHQPGGTASQSAFPGCILLRFFPSYGADMLRQRSLLVAILILGLVSLAPAQQKAKKSGHVPTPSEFLGFEVGADRKLADYRQITSYFKALAAASPRLEIQDLGKTTLGEKMIMVVISSEENLRNKTKYQEIARKLADPRGLSQQQIDALAAEGKTVFLLTCNIHSTEIGSSQMAMEWAYRLVTAQHPGPRRPPYCAILLLVPSPHPDRKAMYGVLTEVASARIATPVEISSTELQGGSKGLITYEQQINFPNPWPGGVWRLRDIMDYELLVSDAALETVSKYRQELLRGVATMATEAIKTADPTEFWKIPIQEQ